MAKLKTGVGIAAISGTSGGAVFATRRDGSVILRERPSPVTSDTTNKQHARLVFARASSAWRALTLEQQTAWLQWARVSDPFAGASGAANAFRSLAVRWFGFHALDQDPPALPPAAPFGGDAVRIAVTGETGHVRFTADRANAIGVGTELLAVKVISALADPRERDFRAVARVSFTTDVETVTVNLPRRRYVLGARFVLLESGQATGVLRLGTVGVA